MPYNLLFLPGRRRTVDDLTDDDFAPGFQQKAVDMRIGLDIAAITLKKQADTIVLVTGDSDFVPAAKLARREGVRIILDPLWHHVAPDLHEHCGAAIPTRRQVGKIGNGAKLKIGVDRAVSKGYDVPIAP